MASILNSTFDYQYLVSLEFILQNNILSQFYNQSSITEKHMNREIKTKTESSIENLNAYTHQNDIYRKFEPKIIADGSQRKEQNIEDNLSKQKHQKYEFQYHKSRKHNQKDYSINGKPFKLYSLEQMKDKINKILIKNALSHTRQRTNKLMMNTSIEERENCINQTQISSKVYKYTLFTIENEQQHKQNHIQQQKSKHKLDLYKLRLKITKNGTFYTPEQTKRMQLTNKNFEQQKLQTEIITPSENSWQNSMKLLRQQKKQYEKNRKYCRILIRRINTDQLFTKRTQSKARLLSNKTNSWNKINSIKPIKSVITDSKTLKVTKKKRQTFKNQLKEPQDIELNPWSTTQIKNEMIL